MPSIEIVRPTHAMTLPLLIRAFDVIFVVAGENKASIGHELFKVHKRRSKGPVEQVQPKSRIVL
jgi:6-phosphogluconolactonase/glucosamine-6-phosphate isomerase/deaminase